MPRSAAVSRGARVLHETGKVTRLLTPQVGLISTDRFHKNSTAKLADVTTGEVRTLFTETDKTHVQTRVQWQLLWKSSEVLWYSQREDTAQLYLVDNES